MNSFELNKIFGAILGTLVFVMGVGFIAVLPGDQADLAVRRSVELGVPAWVLGALGVVGGLLPALGIALSLSLLWHGWNPAWFVLGFVICALADVPLLPFTLLAAAVAYIVVVASDDAAPQTGPVAPATARPSALLTRRDLLHSSVIWLFFSHANYNYERWQGTGFAHAMAPVLRRLYPARADLAEALMRHTVYYNSEPNVGALTNGVVVALEEARARGEEIVSAKAHFGANGMALAMGEGDGFVKVVARAADRTILGVHIMGPEAASLLGEATLAVAKHLTAEDVANTIHAHPTLCECFRDACRRVMEE